MAIPKIIHQCFPYKHDLPRLVVDIQDSLKKLNPDWEYRLYDDQDMLDFIEGNFDSQVRQAYLKINPLYGAARVDLFRYLLIHKVGGAYFDIKSSAARPLDDIIDGHDYVLAPWMPISMDNWFISADTSHGHLQQWHILGAPGHPFLQAVIDAVLRNIDDYSVEGWGVARRGVFGLTGPKAYTQAIRPLINQHKHKWYNTATEAGLIYSKLRRTDSHLQLFPRTHPHYSALREPVVFHSEQEMVEYKKHAPSRPYRPNRTLRYG